MISAQAIAEGLLWTVILQAGAQYSLKTVILQAGAAPSFRQSPISDDLNGFLLRSTE